MSQEEQGPDEDGNSSGSAPRPEDPGFAPAGLNDGRRMIDHPARPILEWRTGYDDPLAQRWIRAETAYLVLICLAGVAAVVLLEGMPLRDTSRQMLYLLAGGAVGGSVFALKWQYHVIAKGLWHLDRRAWRFIVPLNSAAVALMFGVLIRSGLIRIFREDSLSGEAAIGFAFLAGYFSDNAIAKLREVAGTLFGQTEQHSTSSAPRTAKRSRSE